MALNLINKSDTNNKGVTGLADTPGLTASQMQKKFDELSIDVIIPKFNENVEKLNAEDGANELTITNPDSKRMGSGTTKGIGDAIRKLFKDLYDLSGKFMTPLEGLNARFDEKADNLTLEEYQTNIDEEIATFEGTVNTQIEDISGRVDTANANSETAMATSEVAVTTANESKLIAETANTNSENAVSTANEAKELVDSVGEAVEEAKQASERAVTAAGEAKEAAEEASRSAVKIDDTQITTSTTYSSQKIENRFEEEVTDLEQEIADAKQDIEQEFDDVTHFEEVADLSGEVPGFNARTLNGHTSDFFAEKNEVNMLLDMDAIPEELGPTVGGAISALNSDLLKLGTKVNGTKKSGVTVKSGSAVTIANITLSKGTWIIIASGWKPIQATRFTLSIDNTWDGAEFADIYRMFNITGAKVVGSDNTDVELTVEVYDSATYTTNANYNFYAVKVGN